MALNKIKSDLAIATGSQLLEKIIGYLILMVLTRYMLKETVGDYFLAVALSLIVAFIADMGTNSHLVRSIAKHPHPPTHPPTPTTTTTPQPPHNHPTTTTPPPTDNPDHATNHHNGLNELSAVMTLRLGLSVIGYVVLNGFIAVTRPQLLDIMLLTSLYTLVMGLFYGLASFFVGHRWMGTRVLIGMCGQILMLVSVGLMVLMKWDLRELLICYVVANSVTFVLAWIIIRRAFGPFFWFVSMRAVRAMAAAAFPIFILGFLQLIQFKVDTIMLGFIPTATGNSPSQEVARYETAYKLFEASRFIARPFSQVFLPITAALAAQGLWVKLRGKTRRLLGLALLGGILMSLPVLVFADIIIPMIFGPTYQDSIVILRVLFLTTPLMFVSFVAMFLSNATHQERKTVWAMMACLILNVLVNAVVIPHYGALGAAWATMASETLMAVCLTAIVLLYLRRQIQAGLDTTLPDPPTAREKNI